LGIGVSKNKLEIILDAKKKEVALLKAEVLRSPQSALAKLMEADVHTPQKNVRQILSYASVVHVIAEIKRKSPAGGEFASITDPLALAQQYIAGGACAISVLTDHLFFGGSLQDLEKIAHAADTKNTLILRKDFLIDPIQLYESILYGADMVLLIVAALGDQLPAMLQKTKALNLAALVEVYRQDEIQKAVDAGAEIILVNNRNLKTFETNTETAFQLAPYLPKNTINIAASGIMEMDLAKQYHRAGYAAVLVGEALVRSDNPAEWIVACRQ
jgi:indole-3-glycerol phosphate synthase